MTNFNAHESEQVVLGAVLLDNETLEDIGEHLTAESFAASAHKAIYVAMQTMHEKHKSIDAITLIHELGEEIVGVGGEAYIATLMGSTFGRSEAKQHIGLVKEAHTRRTIQAALAHGAALNSSREIAETIDYLLKTLADLSLANEPNSLKPLRPMIEDALNEGYLTRHDKLSGGLSTGIVDVDSVIGGLHKADLILLAARPGQGKTSLVCQIAAGVAKKGYKVGIFSLEMSAREIALKVATTEAGIDASKMRMKILPDAEWDKVLHVYSRSIAEWSGNLYIDDSFGVRPMEMLARARRMAGSVGLDLVIVDYVQLMTKGAKTENRQQEVSEISRETKGLARSLNVPVLCCAQLNRSIEQRKNREPELSDLRESGSLEQDADIVAFLHRTDDEVMDGRPIPIDLIVKKHRHGPIGKRPLLFHPISTRFTGVVERGDSNEPFR